MNSRTKIVLAGILLLAIMIPTALSINSGQGSNNVVIPAQQTNTQGMPGLVCFQYSAYSDTWILSFLQTGPSEFLASGYDSVYPAAMTGGGAIVNGQLLLSLDERIPGYAQTGQHNIMINMTTTPYSGIDRLAWFDINGTLAASYPVGLTFTEIACPSGAQPTIVVKKTTAGH